MIEENQPKTPPWPWLTLVVWAIWLVFMAVLSGPDLGQPRVSHESAPLPLEANSRN